MCPNYTGHGTDIDLSLDGVSETKSSTVSLDVYSARFLGCRTIYPVTIVKPIVKRQYDKRDVFKTVLNDSVTDHTLKTFIADNPKRSFVRDSLSHNARFACEYCFAQGDSFTIESIPGQDDILTLEQMKSIETNPENLRAITHSIDSIKKKKQTGQGKKIVWPNQTRTGELRTRESILQITSQLENSPETSVKGINGHSFLLDVPHFDFVHNIPVEYMHSVAIGLVKRLLELCFNVGESRPRKTKRKLTEPAAFNREILNVKVPREFSRRCRKVDFSVLKAQEMRNICIFFFPLLLDSLPKTAQERKLWVLLAFAIRASLIPLNEINFPEQEVSNCMTEFYMLFEQLFGSYNCTYTVHVVCSHLLLIRNKEPLTATSAFPFENFYSELRHSYAPGTPSTLKQIFQSVLLKTILAHHCCSDTIYYSAKDTALECNSLVYTYTNGTHQMYKIKKYMSNY